MCSKRRELKAKDWITLARSLTNQGKQIVLSTMALLEAASEIRVLRQLCDNGELLIEPNDMAAIQLASRQSLPFVCGPAINCYNTDAIQLLVNKGMTRWVMPVELSADWLTQILQQCEQKGIRDQLEVEVMGYGQLPLAYSARCFTARSENREKDNCELCCIKYPQGRPVNTQEDQQAFVVNGIQTQSGYYYNLINELPHMQGVDIIRISPNATDSLEQASRFKQQLKTPQTEPIIPGQCNGYWHKIAGLEVLR